MSWMNRFDSKQGRRFFADKDRQNNYDETYTTFKGAGYDNKTADQLGYVAGMTKSSPEQAAAGAVGGEALFMLLTPSGCSSLMLIALSIYLGVIIVDSGSAIANTFISNGFVKFIIGSIVFIIPGGCIFALNYFFDENIIFYRFKFILGWLSWLGFWGGLIYYFESLQTPMVMGYIVASFLGAFVLPKLLNWYNQNRYPDDIFQNPEETDEFEYVSIFFGGAVLAFVIVFVLYILGIKSPYISTPLVSLVPLVAFTSILSKNKISKSKRRRSGK